jgi:Domain of unknown function (DUF1844)
MASGDSKSEGFRVTDRRSFGEGGEPKAEVTSPPAANPPSSGGTPVTPPAATTSLPAVDFHTFVLSLGSSALLHLGEIEHPDVGATQKDLPLAKHTIDILVMLEQKTKGNLTPAEEKLMQSLLYDLRLRYVEAQGPGAK